jgi:hypothetical protein
MSAEAMYHIVAESPGFMIDVEPWKVSVMMFAEQPEHRLTKSRRASPVRPVG